jgi:hypothetical protein
MIELTGKVGFASPIAEKSLSRRRSRGVELIATLALAVSLIVAAAAVSIGVARAQAFASTAASDRAPFAVALFFGAVMVGMSGLTAIVTGERQLPRD